MKTCVSLALALLLLLTPALPAFASGLAPVTVTVDNVPVTWEDAEPYQDAAGNPVVPLRPIAEALGLSVDWNEKRREATFYKDSRAITFQIDSLRARTMNTGYIDLDTPPVIYSGRIYGPVTSLAEYFGCVTAWNGRARKLSITTAEQAKLSESAPPAPINVEFRASLLKLDKNELTLFVGETTRLTARIFPSTAQETKASFTSSNARVATVSSDGMVTALREGTAEIVAATANGKADTCYLTVRRTSGYDVRDRSYWDTTPTHSTDDSYRRLYPDGKYYYYYDGSYYNFDDDYYFYDGYLYRYRTPEDETVYYDSYRYGYDNYGYYTQRVYATSLTLNADSVALSPGGSYALRVSVYPSYAVDDVAFVSRDKDVATVTDSGRIIAVDTGTTEIFALASGGATASVTVTVS